MGGGCMLSMVWKDRHLLWCRLRCPVDSSRQFVGPPLHDNYPLPCFPDIVRDALLDE